MSGRFVLPYATVQARTTFSGFRLKSSQNDAYSALLLCSVSPQRVLLLGKYPMSSCHARARMPASVGSPAHDSLHGTHTNTAAIFHNWSGTWFHWLNACSSMRGCQGGAAVHAANRHGECVTTLHQGLDIIHDTKFVSSPGMVPYECPERNEGPRCNGTRWRTCPASAS
jgi:hypothetical protein